MSLEATPRIPSRYRAALAAKAALLLFLMGVFLALTVSVALGAQRHLWVRVLFGAFFAVNTLFLAWTAGLGWADVIFGRARVVSGARPLPSRRSGVSLKLPDGHFAEYILHNPWQKLLPDHCYQVTIGQYSRVVVAEPVDEGVAP